MNWEQLLLLYVQVYAGHGYEVLDARGSFDNSQLCSGGMDKTVMLWDVASGKILRRYRGHGGKNVIHISQEQ